MGFATAKKFYGDYKANKEFEKEQAKKLWRKNGKAMAKSKQFSSGFSIASLGPKLDFNAKTGQMLVKSHAPVTTIAASVTLEISLTSSRSGGGALTLSGRK